MGLLIGPIKLPQIRTTTVVSTGISNADLIDLINMTTRDMPSQMFETAMPSQMFETAMSKEL